MMNGDAPVAAGEREAFSRESGEEQEDVSDGARVRSRVDGVSKTGSRRRVRGPALGSRKENAHVGSAMDGVVSCPFAMSRTLLDGPREVHEDVVRHIEEDVDELADDILLALLGHGRGGCVPRGRKCRSIRAKT